MPVPMPPYQNVGCAGGLLGDLITTIMLMWPNPGRQSNIIANKLVMVAQASPSPFVNPTQYSSSFVSSNPHPSYFGLVMQQCAASSRMYAAGCSGVKSIQLSLTREQRSEGPHIVCGQVCIPAICLSRCTIADHALVATNCGASYSLRSPDEANEFRFLSFSCSLNACLVGLKYLLASGYPGRCS